LANSTDPSVWTHPPEGTLPNGRYSAKSLDPSKDADSKDYCVLINGSTDAAYTITTVNWSSTTAGGATPEDHYTSVALEGSLDISEPKGIVFLDQMIRCCVELGVDSANAVFVVKTFFVGFGYEAGAGDFADTVTDVAPFMFTVIGATGAFTAGGGTYHLDVVSCVDGTARLPQYSKVGNTISFQGKATLADTMSAFQNSIQSNYNWYYECVQAQLATAFAAADIDPDQVDRAISRVQYVIEMGNVYNDTLYKVNDAPEQANNTTDCSAPAQIHIPNHLSIEDGIHLIMGMSSQVKKDAAEGVPSAGDNTIKKYTYKIRTAVHTEPFGGSGTNKRFKYTVYYKVEQFMSPQDVANAHAFMDLATKTGQDKAVSDPSLASNIINFEYLYTGKNVDILEFDIKINAGLAYLQTATTANSYRGQLEKTQSKSSATSAIDLSQFDRGGVVVPRPVFFGSQVKAPAAKNTQHPNITIQAAYTMTKHASIELTEATMRIYGNPNLLSSVTATSSTETLMTSAMTSASTTDANSLNDAAALEADFKHWSYIPAFAKVKVKMPRNNDDILAFTGGTNVSDQNMGNLDYAQDFWFDGYYYVMGIDHSFDNGEFTQTLHMLGIVPDKALAAMTSNQSSKSNDLTQNIDKCYDSLMGCGPQPSAPATSSSVPPLPVPIVIDGFAQWSTEPTDKATADVVVAASLDSSDLSRIKGWDEATNDVKQAILNAAANYRVNAFTLALIAATESNLQAGARNQDPIGSHAAGLFQFVHKTWLQYFPVPSTADIYNPYDNADAGARLLSANINSLGGQPISGSSAGGFSAGDAYLLHFNGGWGPQAIKLDKAGKGDITLRALFDDVYKKGAARQWQLQYTNSPTNQAIFDRNNSATLIRGWAARIITTHLKHNTVPVAGAPSGTPPGTPSGQNTIVTPGGTVYTARQARDALANMKPCPPDAATANKEETGKCNKVPVVQKSGPGGTASAADAPAIDPFSGM
jgi:hypothetical protein